MIQIFHIVFLVFLVSYVQLAIATNTFNSQVGARAREKIYDYLSMVSKAGSLPLAIINEGLVNLTDGKVAGPLLFYPSMTHYNGQITNFYLGLETGLYYAYGNQIALGPEILFDMTDKVNSQWTNFRYYVNPKTGSPTIKTGFNKTYDCRLRPWYMAAKTSMASLWSEPYLDYGTREPLLSYLSPILNYSLNGKYMSFAGTAGADIYLTDISKYLISAFGDTDQKVFIIDKNSGNVLGNSWGAPTSITTSNGPVCQI